MIRATQAKFPLFVDTGVDASAIEVFDYLVVTAVDVAGNESAYSEELTVVVP